MEQTSRLSIVIDTGNAQRDLQNLRRALTDLEGSSGRAVGGVQRLDGSLQSISRGFGLLKGVIGALGLGMTVGSIISTADSMQNLNNQLKLATGSAEKFGIAMESIERIAMENKVSLQSVGEMYVSNERALKQLGKGQQEVLRFTENVTKAMAVGGGSAEAQAAALTQLGQAMASGVLRGDEFNSIAEQAPMIMTLMADSLKVTTGELRKMAADGKLTADVVYEALTNAEATTKLQSMTGATATTVSQAMQQVSNQWELAVNKIMNGEGGISQSLASMISGFAGVIPKVLEFGEAFAQSEAGKSIIEGLGTAFDTLKGAVSDIGEFLTPIGDFLTNNSELVASMSAGLLAGATAYYTITTAMGLFATVSTAVATAGGLAAVATTALGTAIAFVTSPITLAVVAIGALVAAGVYLYRNWDEVKAKTEEVWFAIGEIVANMVDNIKGKWDEFYTAVGGTTAMIVENAVGKFNELKAKAKSIFDSLPAPVKTALTAIGTVVSTQFSLIKNIFTTTFAVIKALVRGDMDGVKKAISDGMTKAWNAVKKAVTDIVGEFKGLGAKLKQVGMEAIQGLIEGIASKFDAVKRKVGEIANYIPSGMRKILDIHSPSRVMREIGAWAGEGFVLGVGDKVKDAKQVAQDLANALTNTITDLHRQEFMLKNHANPLAEWQYKVQFGELAELTDKQKARVLELARANLDLAKSNDINKSISDEIASIDEKLETHGMNRLEILEWQIKNTEKYKGANQELLATLKDQIRAESELNQQFKAREKLKGYEDSLAKNTYLYRTKGDKYAGERWDLSQQGFDGQYIEQMIETLRQSDVMSAMANMPKTLTMPTLQNNNVGSAVSSAVTGYFDLKKQLDDNLTIIEEAENAKLITEQESQLARLEQEKAFHEARQNLVMAGADNILGSMANATKAMLGEQSSAYRAMFALQQSFAIGAAIVNIHKAISDAFAEGTTLAQKFAGVATATTQGMKIVSAIQQIRNPVIGQAHDGIMSVPKSGTWNLEKGERVLPKHTAQNLDRTLNNLQGGGQVINVNVTVNSDGGDVQSSHDMGKSMGNAIKLAIQAELQKERRQGGLLYR